MNPPRIEILCDGGPAWGLGHLRRSTVIAHELARRGARVAVTPLSEAARPLLPPAPQDGGPTALWFLDLPYAGDAVLARCREQGGVVMALDYVGETAPDMEITLLDRGTAPAGAPRKAGLEYTIIRQEIRRWIPASAGSGVLVMIGGGDLEGVGAATARRLAAEGLNVTLIEGPLTPMERGQPDGGYLRLRDPLDLPERMARCAWAVTNGGSSMLELMSLGKAVQVLPQTDFEVLFAGHVAQQGGILGVNRGAWSLPAPEACASVAATARRLIDGRGVERIAEEVLRHFPTGGKTA